MTSFHVANRSISRMATAVAVSLWLVAGCSTAGKNASDNFDGTVASAYDDRLSRGLYVVAGLGSSRLEPDTSRVEGVDADDLVEPAGQLTLGADLTKHLAIEAHTADLGSAGISPEGRINYHINGASALLYAGGNRDRFRRQGLTGFGRIGVGVLDNSPVGNVDFDQANGTHVLVGAGLEYMTPIGLGVRAEGVAFDTDVQYAQVGLMYRTGRKKPANRPQLAKAEVEPVVPVKQEQPVIAAAAPAPTGPCVGLDGLLDGVVFPTDSAGLTMQSVQVLDQVASKLTECPELYLELSAHTDERGSIGYNEDLAGRRAESVLNYLRATGLRDDRLIVNAVGETSPIDSNATPEGRARNRRVDLIAR